MDRYGCHRNGYLCIGCRGRRRGPERGRAARFGSHGGVGGIKPVIEDPFGPPEAGKRRAKRPLAHIRSPRDNWPYRASFNPPNPPLKSRRRAQWRLFTDWCDDVDLRSMPAEPFTVARYLAVRAAWPHSPSSKSTSGRATTLLQRSRCKRVCDKFGGDRQDRRNIQ